MRGDGSYWRDGVQLPGAGDECCCWDAKTAWALAVAPSFRGGKARTGHAESYAKHGIEDLPRGDLLSHPGDPTSTSPAARRVRGVGEGCEALCARVAALYPADVALWRATCGNASAS